ncbi:MAG: glutathione transferase GstA [Dongiaceae bacterium]
MKLYFSPGACSLAPHIALREAGFKFDTEQVDLATKKTKSGADYRQVNPKGYVPALQLDNGEVLTEVPVILQYIADQKPESGLVPKAGTMERYRTQEWLNFVTSELHKGFGALFNPAVPDAYRTIAIDKVGQRLDFLAGKLDGKQYLQGDRFTAPDAYLFTILGWAPYLKVSLDKWPALGAYSGRVAARPAVQAALKAEGLVK